MPLPTSGSGLHVRYEKAGVILDALPIPWNADAVILEANVRLPGKTPAAKHDFTLRLAADQPPMNAELIVPARKTFPLRAFFRLPTPPSTCVAHVSWRDHSLGEVELPIIAQATFEASVALEMPTLQAALGGQLIACRSYVTGQAKSVQATALVRSPTPLAPALHQSFRVEVHRDDGNLVASVPVPLVGDQLRARQTLVSALLPKLRHMGHYRVSWHLGSRCLHAAPLRVLSRRVFQRSLRISATRFIVQRDDDTMQTLRSLPLRDGQLDLDGVRTVVPCFYVTSGVAGMAGLAPLTLRALVGDVVTTLGIDRDALVTDSPTPIVLGAAPAADLARVKHFTLAIGDRPLGNLALLPAPTAEINAEGGFAPLDDFLWTPAAEEQLNERLGKLLEGG